MACVEGEQEGRQRGLSSQSEKAIGEEKRFGLENMRLSRRSLFAFLAMLIMASTVALVAYAYESPRYSWSPSIRDHDGDGVPDSKDAYPYDSEFWGRANATLVVTIVNDFGRDLNYELHASFMTISISRPIADGSSVIETHALSWRTGENDTLWCEVSVWGCFFNGDSRIDVGGPHEWIAFSPDETVSITLTMK